MKKTVKDFNLTNKTVILRCDLNVSIYNNKIIDDTKIKESLKTINYLLDNNCKVIILSHLGKIKEEQDKEKYSLKIVYQRLKKYLKANIIFLPYTNNSLIKETINKMSYGSCLLLENTRFEDIPLKKESNCNLTLASYWASLGDIFINDAFGTIHRNHASTFGISKYKETGIGFLVEKELQNLDKLDNPKRPFVIILGGSKVSSKINLIESLLPKVDKLLIAGAMSFTFLKAANINISSSLVEENMLDKCKELLTKYVNKIILPVDFYGSRKFSNLTKKELFFITDLPINFIPMDIGQETIKLFSEELIDTETVFINGPLGVYEFSKYNNGTKKILEEITNIKTSIVGGGDIVSCLKKYKLENKITFISTGGGATLEYLINKNLPGLINIKESTNE